MDEQNQEHPTPPPSDKRLKIIKALTLTFVFLIVFFALGFVGVEQTSTSKFCSSCHEMQPEFYTWKASSHSEVDCVQCHIGSSPEDYAKAKANGLVEVYKKYTNTYTAPIRMPDEIPDSACEKCHNINTRNFTVSGDLIIPHDKHKTEGIECIQCHSGTAHGKVADRKMTFQSDYQKWDEATGKSAMSNFKFIKPDMDTCIDCHKARKITTECSACHTTGMIPDSHKKEDFKTKTHGELAKTDLKECNVCHKDMSKGKLEGYEEESVITQFLNEGSPQPKKNHLNYARENTFCQDCHDQRPASHEENFFGKHGTLANKNKESCAACHDIKRITMASKNKVNCYTCHPSSHTQDWRTNHKVPITENQKPSASCFKCHAEKKCTACHRENTKKS